SSGARKAMHRAASPFVAGEYVQKRIIEQGQLFWKETDLSAFLILSGLPLKVGGLRILAWCGRKTGALPRPSRKCARHEKTLLLHSRPQAQHRSCRRWPDNLRPLPKRGRSPAAVSRAYRPRFQAAFRTEISCDYAGGFQQSDK